MAFVDFPDDCVPFIGLVQVNLIVFVLAGNLMNSCGITTLASRPQALANARRIKNSFFIQFNINYVIIEAKLAVFRQIRNSFVAFIAQ